jgi:multiple sugar transport system permease protein
MRRDTHAVFHKFKKGFFNTTAWFFLMLAVVWSVFPILLIYASALKPPKELFTFPPTIFGRLTFQNFVDLARDWPEFWLGMRNSVIVTVGSVILTLLVVMPAALAFSRFRGRLIKYSGIFVIVSRMFPPIVITIPLYPLLQISGLMDKHIVLIVLYSAFYIGIGIWILKTFIDNIPLELEESAYLEGCTRFQVFTKITLPLSASGLVSISILLAIFCWKEFFFAFLFTTFEAVTAPVVLHELVSSTFGISWGPLFAGTALQLLPILIFVILVQKWLVRGISYSRAK